jgi:hypothetical protein
MPGDVCWIDRSLGKQCWSTGECRPRDWDCYPGTPGQVCGCDRTMYDSQCLANQAGASVMNWGSSCVSGGS